MTSKIEPNTKFDGFILTRQWLETSSGVELVFWFASATGPVRLRLSDQEAICFFCASQTEKVKKILRASGGWKTKSTSLTNFANEPVSALYFPSQRQLYSAREKLQAAGIQCYEADIKPTDRYLMERFITGSAKICAHATERQGFTDLLDAQLKPTDFRPLLSAVSIDIETDYSAETLYSVAIYSETTSLVLMIGKDVKSAFNENFSVEYFATESLLLSRFMWIVEDIDPDILMGWNVVNFDLRCLQRFCDRAKLELRLGRNREVVKWRQSKESDDRFYALLPGRVVLDGIEIMRSATYQFENFSLEYVSRQLLDRGKLVEDVDSRGAEITELFHSDKNSLAEYNLEDCKLVWDIFQKEKLVDFAIERSILTGLELDRAGGSVAAMDFLYLPRLHRRGYVAPALEQLESKNISPGGYVMDSVPGIHKDVVVLDFKSLYPSIIKTFNVDPASLVQGPSDSNPIVGFDGGLFSREQGILPELVTTLWAARDSAKSKNNQVLSQAIKIIMNSFYGVLGTMGCRFFDSRLVSSITKRGHEIIIKSKAYIESKGYPVIYGDTDSLFVLLDQVPEEEVAERAKQIASELNDWWIEKLEREHHLVSHLEMEFETHFRKFFMPTVRGSEAGSKKRYAGLVGSDEMVFKGLETVRSDWSPLAREFQKRLYRKIFYEQPCEQFIKDTVQKLMENEQKNELVIRKRLRRKLSAYVKNIPPHVQAARKAENIRAEKGLPSLYESGGWIEYIMTVNGPEPKSYLRSQIDYDFYIDRQLAPIADSILVFQSQTMAEILNRQIGLF
ncbi:MAG: DNA polymerase II [Pseudohongiellaceae bacterium]